MYYLKNRYYDSEIRRFICADAVTLPQCSLDTLHNKNLYSYCDQNPVDRSDNKGGIWQFMAAGFAIGAIGSIACQTFVEGKSISEISWKDAISTGVTTAASAYPLGRVEQVVLNAVAECVTSIWKGESVGTVVINTALGALSGVSGGIGESIFDKYMRYFNFELRMNKIRIPDIAERTAANRTARNEMYLGIANDVAEEVGSTITSYISSWRHIGSGAYCDPKNKIYRKFNIFAKEDANGRTVLKYVYI